MVALLVIVVVFGVLIWQFTEGKKAPAQAVQIIGTAFGGARSVIWRDASGPGTINKRRMGVHRGITMSANITPLSGGGCRVDMWASEYAEFLLVLVNFAGVVNRRKRAIAQLLTEPGTARPAALPDLL